MDIERARSELVDSLQDLGECHLFIVSNEVGLGLVPENEMARRFRDEQGRLNQRVAECADEVYLMAAGIPVRIK
jgi:adenosylcobinamide kinase/adenosylcobinamide-phosphate guanylyltransferase